MWCGNLELTNEQVFTVAVLHYFSIFTIYIEYILNLFIGVAHVFGDVHFKVLQLNCNVMSVTEKPCL